MNWNFDIEAAPRGKTASHERTVGKGVRTITDFIPDIVLIATKCGKVIRSYWIPEAGNNPGRWSGLGTGEQPEAWALWPTHPYRPSQAPSKAKQPEAATS